VKNPKMIAAIAAAVVVVIAVSFWMMRRGSGSSGIDFTDPAVLQNATKKVGGDVPTDGGTMFEVKDVTIAGQTHRAIYAPPHSRLIYKVEVPRRGVLTVWYGLREDAMTKDTDGAQFRIGVSDGRTYEEYVREFINPKANERDRRWFDATIDLSAYEGQQVDIIFNTDPGAPRGKFNTVGDYTVWAEPKLAAK
jgi:hypothetical protein